MLTMTAWAQGHLSIWTGLLQEHRSQDSAGDLLFSRRQWHRAEEEAAQAVKESVAVTNCTELGGEGWLRNHVFLQNKIKSSSCA